jgi:hypothetical protein
VLISGDKSQVGTRGGDEQNTLKDEENERINEKNSSGFGQSGESGDSP